MDTAKARASGVTVISPGASSSYHVGPITENFGQGTLPTGAVVITQGPSKKKRGRPRKYKPDESTSRAPMPVPLSSSAPPAATKSYVAEKKPSLERPISSEKKHRNKVGAEKLDDFSFSIAMLLQWVISRQLLLSNCEYFRFTYLSDGAPVINVFIAVDENSVDACMKQSCQICYILWIDDLAGCSTGSSFLPHVITVNTGEFSLQGPRIVCVISGTGTVSTVTIRHPSSSRDTVTYEKLQFSVVLLLPEMLIEILCFSNLSCVIIVQDMGLFEILSFTGTFNPDDSPDLKYGRSGMMTISLSGADCRVVGGLIGGDTIAASPVKVFVASFLVGSPNVLKPKKQKMETPFAVDGSGPNGAPAVNVDKRSLNNTQGPSSSMSVNPINWEATQIAAERPRKSTADINISLQG
ncbi:hypothetical protein DH2020_023252 [Rehmannia glutinosa]|uniref:AT-hook motif nuclear-localized protein n=1 Tax=Rehmannia glutinosa TaxID=99300 RepID=A0ABR0W9B2_REHGL